jgi:hypothetical protein
MSNEIPVEKKLHCFEVSVEWQFTEYACHELAKFPKHI